MLRTIAVVAACVGVNASPLPAKPVGTLSEPFWGGDAPKTTVKTTAHKSAAHKAADKKAAAQKSASTTHKAAPTHSLDDGHGHVAPKHTAPKHIAPKHTLDDGHNHSSPELVAAPPAADQTREAQLPARKLTTEEKAAQTASEAREAMAVAAEAERAKAEAKKLADEEKRIADDEMERKRLEKVARGQEPKGLAARTALVAPESKFGGDHEAHAPSGYGRTDTEFSGLSTKAPAGAAVARRMNERFNKEKLEHITDMIIIHQWDGWEHPEAKWKQCPEGKNLTGDLVWSVCAQAGAIAPRRPRVSSAIIHAGMQKRIGKEHGVPLFSYEGGIALKPTKNVVSCGYGVDAGTDDADRGGSNTGACFPSGGKHGCVPGCGEPPQWCDAKDPNKDNCQCGFEWCSGRPHPWRPEDIGGLLEAQMSWGPEYGGLGSLNGYNEIIIDATYRDAHLPDSIEAFFYVAGCTGTEAMLGHTCEGREEQSKMHEVTLTLTLTRTRT